jgi:hypothetical protein
VKNEPSESPAGRSSLEQRFADHPEVIVELHALRDEMERALASGALAHEVEAMLQKRMRELGRRLLGGWAVDDQEGPASQPPGGASKHAKKNFTGKASSAGSRSANKSGA